MNPEFMVGAIFEELKYFANINNLLMWNFFQIVSDLLHFKGSHKHEFDSRWKSFNLVKKSMENRVRFLFYQWVELIIYLYV